MEDIVADKYENQNGDKDDDGDNIQRWINTQIRTYEIDTYQQIHLHKTSIQASIWITNVRPQQQNIHNNWAINDSNK